MQADCPLTEHYVLTPPRYFHASATGLEHTACRVRLTHLVDRLVKLYRTPDPEGGCIQDADPPFRTRMHDKDDNL
jgi:hypothetical protein